MEKEEKDEKHHRIESMYGSFMRSFTLPQDVEADKVEASFKDGILKVHLPKSKTEPAKSVKVNIQ